MTDRTRIRIAAGVTALFLAGISAAGLAAAGEHPQAATTTVAPPSEPVAADGDDERHDTGILEEVRGIGEKTRAALDDVTGLVREHEDDD